MKLSKIDKKKIIVRPFRFYDAYNSNYFGWLADKEVTKFIYRDELGDGFNKQRIIKHLKKILNSKKDLFFSVLIGKKMIGTLKISKISKKNKSGELGIMIGEKNYWKQGLGKILISYLVEYCFQKLKMTKIYAGTVEENIGMKKVFLKLGFKIIKTIKLKFQKKKSNSYQFLLLSKNFSMKN